MRLFRINNDEVGAIQSISFTGGYQVHSIEELRRFMADNPRERFYGEGVHRIGISLKGEGIPFQNPSKSGNAEMLSIRLAKATLVDIGKWDLNLELDMDEDVLDGIIVDGKVPSTPTPVVIHDFKKSVFKSGCYNYARDSKVSFMEAMLCSTRIPTEGFKPAYGGGLMGSPADSSIVYENVISYDIASSYPWTAAVSEVPYGSTKSIPLEDLKYMKIENGCIDIGDGVGFIGLFELRGLRRKEWVRIPVLRDKDTHACEGAEVDRIGLVSAESIRIALVPDSLYSLSLQYEWDDYTVEILEAHRVQRLPEGIRNALGGYYERKAKATGADRLRAKLAINTLIGLWGTDPFKKGEELELRDGVFYSRYTRDLPKPWSAYVGIDRDGSVVGGKRCWDYRWAVYTIAAAQRRIVETEYRLQKAGLEILYCDTDSIKMAGSKQVADSVFSKLNARVELTNIELGLPGGMGVWVDESAGYARTVFRAKKFYATEDYDGNKEIHISAVRVEDAAAMFAETTLDDIAASDEVIVKTRRPDTAIVEGSPFGASEHLLQREMVRRYTRNNLFISGGDNVQV